MIPTVSKAPLENIEDRIDSAKQEIQKKLIGGRKKIEAHCQVESARSVISGGDGLLRYSSNVQSWLGKSSAHFCSQVAKELDKGSNESSSNGAKKVRKMCKVSDWKGPKKRTERPRSGSDDNNVNEI